MEIKITRVERNRSGERSDCAVNYYFWHGGGGTWMKTNSIVGNRDRRVAAVEYRAWRVRVKTKIYEFIFTRNGDHDHEWWSLNEKEQPGFLALDSLSPTLFSAFPCSVSCKQNLK